MPDSLGSTYRLYWRAGGEGQSDARQFGEHVQTRTTDTHEVSVLVSSEITLQCCVVFVNVLRKGNVRVVM